MVTFGVKVNFLNEEEKMKRNIKRLTLALIALGLSAPVLADSSPFCVTVPNQQGGFTVGADLLWLRPHTPDLTYSTASTSVTTGLVTTNTTTLSILNPSYHWAFDLMAAYRIPCTGNDITALWTHLSNKSDSASESHHFSSTDPLDPRIDATDFSSTFKYDAVDLDLGQRVNFGDYFNFRMFAGLRGADVKQTFSKTLTATITISPLTGFATLDQSSEFKGIGPQMGIEGRYCIGYGFGIDAGTTLSALVGRVDNSASTATFTLPTTTSSSNSISVDKKNRVVPALDMNLGVDYTFNFNNCSRSSLVIQAGYKVIHYWDVNDRLISNTTASFDPALTGVNTAGSVSFDGPYLGLKVNV